MSLSKWMSMSALGKYNIKIPDLLKSFKYGVIYIQYFLEFHKIKALLIHCKIIKFIKVSYMQHRNVKIYQSFCVYV